MAAPWNDWTAIQQRAEATLTQAGEKFTPFRLRVLKAIADSERGVSAYQIAAILMRDEQRRVAAMSIYRILGLLARHHLIAHVNSVNAYVIDQSLSQGTECSFFICEICGIVRQLPANRNRASFEDQIGEDGFHVRSVKVEILGRCEQC